MLKFRRFFAPAKSVPKATVNNGQTLTRRDFIKAASAAVVTAPQTIQQLFAAEDKTTKTADTTDGRVRAFLAANEPDQKFLNEKLAGKDDLYLADPNFAFDAKRIGIIQKILGESRLSDITHAITISRGDEGLQSLYLVAKEAKAGKNIPAAVNLALVKYVPANQEKNEPAKLVISSYWNGRVEDEQLKYDVINIGDIYRKPDGTPILSSDGKPHRSVPSIALEDLSITLDQEGKLVPGKLKAEEIDKVKQALTKLEVAPVVSKPGAKFENTNDAKFNPNKDKVFVIHPEIRQVTVRPPRSSEKEYSYTNSATATQTATGIARSLLEPRVAYRQPGTDIVEIVLAGYRTKEGALVSVDLKQAKHLDPNGKPIQNRTNIVDKDFKIYP